jgi:hypothetical protein
MAEPNANQDVRSRPDAAVLNEELEAPVQKAQIHIPSGLTNGGVVHVTPLMERIPTCPPHDRKAEEVATTTASAARPPKKRALDQSTTTPGVNRRKRGLPLGLCDWCLACHPFEDEKGSYHVRPPRDNKALHNAITSGAMPKVDPWAGFKATQAARAAKEVAPPEPPKLLRDSLSTLDIPEEVMAIIQSGDSDGVKKYLARLKLEDENIKAREAADAARAAAAMLMPTGPPSKKRRREQAAKDNRQQLNNNDTRPRNRPRAADSALATSQSSNIPPTLQPPRSNVATSSAPTSDETSGLQQPHQQVAASSEASSKKNAEPSDGFTPRRDAGPKRLPRGPR